MNNIVKLLILFCSLLLLSCNENKKNTAEVTEWKFVKTISLKNIAPIGIVAESNFLWLSDVDNNRVVKINLDGKIIKSYDGFKRPMHIALQGHKIYIPEYTSDQIKILENGNTDTFPLLEKTDAIGGISVKDDKVAIADFYNNRIILQQGNKVSIIGIEGHNDGELYYPTDVEIKNNLIYVADAYNNRIQVFDLKGNYVRMIGWNEGIKVATGLKVTDTQIIVADFDGNRILIYDTHGKLIQILKNHFNQPTDIEIIGKNMYITNYKGKSISVFETAF